MKIIKYLELNNKSTLSKLVVWKKRLLEGYIVLKATGLIITWIECHNITNDAGMQGES